VLTRQKCYARGQAKAKCLEPMPRPLFWGRYWGQNFGLKTN